MTEATRPATSALQSKNMWNASDIRPRLLLRMPKKSSTKAKVKLRMRKKKMLRDSPSLKTLLGKSGGWGGWGGRCMVGR